MFDRKLGALADLVQGKAVGRRAAHEIVLFKSVGSALQDIAVAEMCLQKAIAQGKGTVLPVGLVVKGKA